MKTRHRIAVLAIALMASASGTAQSQNNTAEIRIVLPEQPANLEPCGTIITNVGQILSQNVTEALTVIDAKTGLPQPRLATEWNRVDDRTWRIKLRPGVKFRTGWT
jgi:peptide/nickel transport system substrate-binding protein